MKINFNFSQHLKRYFPFYLLGLVSLPLLTSYSISLKNMAKDYEKFTIVSSMKIKDNKSFTKTFNEQYQIKETSVYSAEFSENFFTYMQAYLTFTDIIILPQVEGGIQETAFPSYVELNSYDDFYADDNYLLKDKHYGILLNKYPYFLNLFEPRESTNYYLFINKSSIHIKRWDNNKVTNIVYQFLKDYCHD